MEVDDVLARQVTSLRAAMMKVLETRDKEAKAWFALETARASYSGDAALESRRHLACMTDSSKAEREARLLLATLKTPNDRVEVRAPLARHLERGVMGQVPKREDQ
jgi:hypothetical protein